MLLWFVSLMFAMYQVLTIIGHPFTMLSAAMYASLILVFLFSALPALYESVFWLIGSINYSLAINHFFTPRRVLFAHREKQKQENLLFPVAIIGFY